MNFRKKHRRDSKQAREQLERQKIHEIWQKALNFLLPTKKIQPRTPRLLN